MNNPAGAHKAQATAPQGAQAGDVVMIRDDSYMGVMVDNDFDRRSLLPLLDFYAEAGVDRALDETPHDRFAEDSARARRTEAKPELAPRRDPPPAQPERPAPHPLSAPQAARPMPRAAVSAEDATHAARDRARDAQTLAELERLLASFDGCSLKFSAKNLVFADGDPAARVMLVGEMPGADEDRAGKPFMGRSGQLLDRMLGAVGLDRTQVYIANMVPWRPPGNRNPTPQEFTICKPFIERQIELANPEILVCLGGPATQNLLNMKDGILRSRGRWFSYRTEGGRDIRTLATLHPAYLLRQPVQKRLGWRDFRALRRALDGRD